MKKLKFLKQLESSADSLRLKMKFKSRFSEFDKEFMEMGEKLKSLDRLKFKMSDELGLKLSKKGRLLF